MKNRFAQTLLFSLLCTLSPIACSEKPATIGQAYSKKAAAGKAPATADGTAASDGDDNISTPPEDNSNLDVDNNSGSKDLNIPELPALPSVPVMLTVQHSGFCVDLDGGSSNDTEIVQQKPCNAGKDQMIKVQDAGSGSVNLVFGVSNKCVEVADAEKADGAVVQQKTCDRSAGQKWKLEASNNAQFKIRSELDNNFCLEIDTTAPASRATAQIASCKEAKNQNFRFQTASNGFKAAPPLVPTLDEYCTPKVRFTIENSAGARTVVSLFQGSIPDKIREISRQVCSILYKDTKDAVPDVRILHVYVQEKIEAGLAYVTGNGLKRTLMKISTPSFVNANSSSPSKAAFFLKGVVVHESTHVFQSLGDYGSYAGMIEGLADTVRLKSGFPDTSWRRDKNGTDWNAGYSKTAMFMMYVESKSPDFIYKLNQDLSVRNVKWNESHIKAITGKAVDQWWKEYQADASCSADNLICGLDKLSLAAFSDQEFANEQIQTPCVHPIRNLQ